VRDDAGQVAAPRAGGVRAAHTDLTDDAARDKWHFLEL